MKRILLLFGIAMVLLAVGVNSADTTIGHFWADETSGTVLESSSTPQVNGTVGSASIWNSSGKINGALYCNKLYTGIYTPGGAMTNWSFAAWVKYDAIDNNYMFFQRSGTNTHYLGIATNTQFDFFDTTTTASFTVPTIATNKWYHVIITYNSTHLELFMNNTASSSNPIADGSGLPAYTYYLGQNFDNTEHLDGYLDDIRFYNYTIDATKRATIYNNGVGTQGENDTTAPVITFVYPTTNLSYNDYTGYINFTTNENANCIVNNSNWVNVTGGNITIHSFYNSTPSTLPDGFYAVNVTCNDSLGNTGSKIIYFTLDTTNPIITPDPTLGINATIATNGTLVGYINYTDDNLYFINITLYNHTTIFNISNLDTTLYQYNISEDVSTYPLGTNNLYTEVCDSHTLKEIGTIDNAITKEKISFDGFSILAPDATKITLIKEKDRYNSIFEYEKILSYKTYYVESEYPIKKVKKDTFKGHFVIMGLKRWIDFEEGSDAKVGYTKISDYKYEVRVYNPLNKIEYQSVGSLNCINRTYLWENRGSINITATSIITGGIIDSFTITSNGTLDGSTTNGYYYLQNLTAGNHSIGISGTGYQSKIEIIEINSTYRTYNFTLLPTNSMNLSFYDADSLDLLSGINVTMSLIGLTKQTNETSTGSIWIGNINAGNYTFVYSAPGYRQNQYLIGITNTTSQNLSLYLNNESLTSLVLIKVQDKFNTVLNGVEVTIQRYSGNGWITEQIVKTDFQGRTEGQFVLSTVYYNFILEYLDIVEFGIPNNDDDKKLIYAEDVTNGLLFTIDIYETGDLPTYQLTYGVISNLSYINTSSTGGYFRYHYNDINNNVWTACLEVMKGGGYGIDAYVCNCSTNSVTSESSTLTCVVNQTIGRETYRAKVLLSGSGPFLEDALTIIIGADVRINWGVTGYLIGFFLVLLSYFLFLKVPTISLYVGTAMFALITALGLMFKDLGYSALITLLVITYLVANIKSESGING